MKLIICALVGWAFLTILLVAEGACHLTRRVYGLLMRGKDSGERP